ncbi:MAG: dipicolinic acid synthetase [Oscillospiraceae bacterium]|jgi:dipicolinate synthase subunit A|nr:dipicolinic acid synthetase [Oscillospiraceae bacterium]
MTRDYTFAVLGTEDNRFKELRKLLRLKWKESEPDCAKLIVLPLPLNLTDEVLARLKPEHLVFAGKVSAADRIRAEAAGIDLHDYYEREELDILNAAATAEGAIELASRETDITLWRSRVLILGYGRVGSTLANRLKGLGAYVSVYARNNSDKARIEVCGYRNADMSGGLNGYDIIINTVPARIVNRGELSRMRSGVLLIDLASVPGGVDFRAADELGIRALHALGLPGKVAPRTSAELIRDTIFNMLAEMEVHGDANGN